MPVCPAFRANGFCGNNNCRFIHPTFSCDLCGVICRSQEYLDHHLASRTHEYAKKASSGVPTNTARKCGVCNISLKTQRAIDNHLRTPQHAVRLLEARTRGEAPDPGQIIVNDSARSFDCSVCEIPIRGETKVQHEKGPRHQRKLQFRRIRAALEEAEKDKHGVTVYPGGNGAFDFGIIERGAAVREFVVSAEAQRSGLWLHSANISGANHYSCFSVNMAKGMPLDSPIVGIVTFDSRDSAGQYQDRLEILLYDAMAKRRFAIIRPLAAIVGNKEDYELLRPVAPYVPLMVTKREVIKNIIPGIPPVSLAAPEYRIKLPLYEVPKPLRAVMEMVSMAEKKRMIQTGFLPSRLAVDTHTRWFHALLHIEEYQAEIDLLRYAQEDVELEAEEMGQCYYLEVPGLEEGRPSVIVGDRIIVREHGSHEDEWWEGYVHQVQLSKVGLRFHDDFTPLRGQTFDTRFVLGRLPLRRMHQALDAGDAAIRSRILFPGETHIKNRRPSEEIIRSLTPFDRGVGANGPQMLAVTAILNLPPGSPPFVVWGPPGTGKTISIVETMRQILFANPKARILACAPSNSAADIIAARLTVLGSEIFRLNASSRPTHLMDNRLQKFCSKDARGNFCIPNKETLMKYRVVVSTCVTSAVPYALGIPAGHFSHIFVDEAGQAYEPEALIAIKTMANKDTNLILSGDPKQLGPVVRSSLAIQFKMGMSFLDRLTALPLYDTSKKQGVTIVDLRCNYRNHPAILAFPNQHFYAGVLESRADAAITNSLLRSESLVQAGFPLVFHSIIGKDQRESTSPSFFNVSEASLVKDYVRTLKDDKRLRLKDEHIGVISPYNAQCGKIRKVLEKIKAKDVKVGSVEEFQGQERRVIIISTVRSNLELVQTDIKHVLGFVANPRRFNVAVTRAQALLIVIGNPRILSLDPLWRSFINYVYNRGGWAGNPKPDWDTSDDIEGADLVKIRAAQASAEETALLKRITETVETLNANEEIEDLGDGYEQIERPWPQHE